MTGSPLPSGRLANRPNQNLLPRSAQDQRRDSSLRSPKPPSSHRQSDPAKAGRSRPTPAGATLYLPRGIADPAPEPQNPPPQNGGSHPQYSRSSPECREPRRRPGAFPISSASPCRLQSSPHPKSTEQFPRSRRLPEEGRSVSEAPPERSIRRARVRLERRQSRRAASSRSTAAPVDSGLDDSLSRDGPRAYRAPGH